MKKPPKFRGNIFQEGENPVIWVLVSENVEYEPLFRNKTIPICWNPVIKRRFEAPACNLVKVLKKHPFRLAFSQLDEETRNV